jgi:hypothetical protein
MYDLYLFITDTDKLLCSFRIIHFVILRKKCIQESRNVEQNINFKSTKVIGSR